MKVHIHPRPKEVCEIPPVETEQEWLMVDDVWELTGISRSTLYTNIHQGTLKADSRGELSTVVHKDEVKKYLLASRQKVSRNRAADMDKYEEEWFTVNKLVTEKIINWHSFHKAVARGTVKTQTVEGNRHFIHRDELNRFLRESPPNQRTTRENLEPRLEITYTPMFTGVQSSFG